MLYFFIHLLLHLLLGSSELKKKKKEDRFVRKHLNRQIPKQACDCTGIVAFILQRRERLQNHVTRKTRLALTESKFSEHHVTCDAVQILQSCNTWYYVRNKHNWGVQ